MPKSSERGIAHLLLILVLLAGLVFGVYLVQTKTNLFSKAFGESSIDELTVQLETLNRQQGRGAQGTSTTDRMIVVATQRQDKLLQEVEQNPSSFLEHAKLTSQRNSFPKEVQDYLEAETGVTGKVIIRHFDDFQNNQSKNEYAVNEAGEYLRLYFPGSSPTEIHPGQQVKLSGVRLQSKFVSRQALGEETEVPALPPPVPTPPVILPGDKIGVMVVDFNGRPSQQIPDENILQTLFGEGKSVRNYFQEASQDKFILTGQILGRFTVDYTDPNDKLNKCQTWYWQKQIEQLIKERNIDLGNFPLRMVVIAGFHDCPFGGVADLGLNPAYSFIAQIYAVGVYTHEVGHNLGLDHANSLNCGEKAIEVYWLCNYSSDYNPGRGLEYGDQYDVMGNDFLFHQLNAPHRLSLGWFSPGNVQLVDGSGIYTIESALGSKDNQVQVLKIPKPDTKEFYYLSLRSAVGFDSNLPFGMINGASIHIWDGQPLAATKFVNAGPSSNRQYYALFDEFSITDPYNGITFKQLSHTPNSVTIDIQFGPQQLPPPSPSPSPTVLIKGWTVTAKAICQNKSTPTGQGRIFYAIWPKVPYNLNKPLDWVYPEASNGASSTQILTNHDSNNIYVGLEDESGQKLTPVGTPQDSAIEYGKFFNPPTPLARWNRVKVPAIPLTINFQAPDSWCSR